MQVVNPSNAGVRCSLRVTPLVQSRHWVWVIDECGIGHQTKAPSYVFSHVNHFVRALNWWFTVELTYNNLSSVVHQVLASSSCIKRYSTMA